MNKDNGKKILNEFTTVMNKDNGKKILNEFTRDLSNQMVLQLSPHLHRL